MYTLRGRIQDFKLGGGTHKKNCGERREARKFLGYFVWKIMILRQKIIFFPIVEGGAKFWGISCEKSRFYAKKEYFFPILGGARPPPPPPPESAPALVSSTNKTVTSCQMYTLVSSMGTLSDVYSSFLHGHKHLTVFKPVNGLVGKWCLMPPSTIFQLCSVLLVEETGENHRPVVCHWQTLSHIVISSTPCHEQGLTSQL